MQRKSVGNMKLLLKESLKKIKLTFGRFLSVFFIVALGVGFFAGIRNTSDDMLYTASSYYQEKNLMDLKLVSTLGFTDEDVEILKGIDNVADVEASHYIDCLESSNAVRVLGITSNMNQTTLVDGRMPEKNNEVLADATVYEVGDKLTLNTEDLKENKVEVVGTIHSPMYVQASNKGSTQIGNGKISAYLYTLEDNFDMDVYTVIYITGKNTKEESAYSEEYQSALGHLQKDVEDHLEELKTRRYEEIKKQAEDKIEQAKKQVQEEQEKYQIELDNAKEQLDRSNSQLQALDKKINEKEQLLKEETKKAQAQIDKAKEKLQQSKKDYQTALDEYNTYTAYLDYIHYIYDYDNFPDLSNMTYEEILAYIENLTPEEKEQFVEYIKNGNFNLDLPDIDYTNKEEVKTYLEKLWNNEFVQEITSQIDFNGDKSILEQLDIISGNLKQKLSAASKEITNAERTIHNQEQVLNKKTKESNQLLLEYKEELKKGYNELESGYNTYYLNYDQFEIKFQDAYQKINVQAKEIDSIEKPTIYLFDRNDNAGYEDYKSDATRVNNISKVFPVFFLLVAALVCLNTMSRMVEEDRGQMGIYKSLGFSNTQIVFTYILYVAFATVFGSIIGLLLGCTILPNVIYNIYSFMYVLPDLKLDNNVLTMCMTTILMFIVTLSITLYTALSVLKEAPAALLRPKAPAKGKKVLLEKIGFIWKRLNFSFKVTVRNIFRYKKRIFMTIIGIAGCTALTLAGLGLKDSITGIIKIQFHDITKYKATLVLDDSYQQLDEQTKDILSANGILDPTLIYQELYSYKMSDENNDVYLVVPSNTDELKKYITLRHREDKKEVSLQDDGAVITEKMALNLNVGKGDMVTIYDTNNNAYKIKISDITENYAYNYIYITSNYYKEIFKTPVKYNMVISDLDENRNKDEISTSLLDTNRVLNVSFIEDILERFNDMIDNLNKIVFVILICSCLLAFIVLYNLTTINITERVREIATLKVLGFNDKEVSLYVYRETMILTVIGALIGLVLGVFLHKFVITSAEMEFIMFQRNINGISYVYAFIITMIFSIIISIFTHYKLKKIDMIEALKSVE